MTYTSGNRLATYNGEAIEYDADGNMITGPLAGEMSSYTYDSRNRLLTAGNLSYQYDAENNRTAVNDQQSGTRTDYIINPNTVLSQVLAASDANGSTWYVYGLGLIGQENPDGSYQTYHYDLRGSTVALTDQTGKVTDRWQYGPYGEMVKHEGQTITPFQYCGQYGVMSDSNGLTYMRARYYNPEIRRFVNQDVLIGSIDDSQSLNRFAYVNGEPVDSVDPFGLSPLGVDWGQAGRDISTGFQKTCEANSPSNWQRELESAWKNNKRDLQNGLDVAGTAPLTGSVFDAANGLIYLSNGNRSEAKKYLIYAAPVVGDGAQGFKAAKTIKAVEKTGNTIIESKTAMRVIKKLSPEAKKGYDETIAKLKSGDTRGLNEHALKGKRKGQWAADIKRTGKGRGAGRVIYEKRSDHIITIIEVIIDHKY